MSCFLCRGVNAIAWCPSMAPTRQRCSPRASSHPTVQCCQTSTERNDGDRPAPSSECHLSVPLPARHLLDCCGILSVKTVHNEPSWSIFCSKSFIFSEILPGEYVLSTSLDNQKYCRKLQNMKFCFQTPVAGRGSVPGGNLGLHRVAMKTTRLQTAAPLAVATATYALPAARVFKGHVASLYFDSGFCSYTNCARCTR